MSYFNSIPDENIWLDKVFKYMVDVIVVIVLALLVIHFWGDDVKMDGSSMEPAISSNQVLLMDKFGYLFSEPERYDVIAFDDAPDTEGEQINVKRIIGLPGEKVQIADGKILINGEEIDFTKDKESIVNSGLAKEEMTLGRDEYFVMGDNWNNSEDSRFANIGNVGENQIIGKIYLRVAPFKNIGIIK